MKEIFDTVSAKCSKSVTKAYSTSFSLGIYFLDKKIHRPIYGIYGFVRLADEIVDTFHDYDKPFLLKKFREDTVQAINQKISLNPVLNEFQRAVNQYSIEWELIDTFLKSMEMDLHKIDYNGEAYNQYILGSAEVVGLMCLRVFVNSDDEQYEALKPFAMKLGSAFQKVNFLRDLNADYNLLGRTYFPGINFNSFTKSDKELIQKEIAEEFEEALKGIKMLPPSSRKGVYLAYIYYKSLFVRIKNTPAEKLMKVRIRVPDHYKVGLMFNSLLRNQLNWL